MFTMRSWIITITTVAAVVIAIGRLPADATPVLFWGGILLPGGLAQEEGEAMRPPRPKDDRLSRVTGTAAPRSVRFIAVDTALSRSGRRPLRIKSSYSAGSFKANILISHEDMQKIRRHPYLGGALRSSTVTVVSHPLIG